MPMIPPMVIPIAAFTFILDTILAPITAPAMAAASIVTNVTGSTFITVINMRASVTTGRQWAAFIVPGISLSSTRLPILNIDAVGAKFPIPMVSPMSVTRPINMNFHQLFLFKLFRFL